ncbi:Hsp20/alpha crystallin family protein [Streptomyces sp. NBC_00234]|uniref:Hsp20/alpha crystallin family protein n=1 Tax=Streptomyces sp. NBC_00234 TaxID=2903638 RepID=UPI002E27BEE8|nr:Hsp20/alpha crystallin family protein [Streptomyces sp. NBC_00234]
MTRNKAERRHSHFPDFNEWFSRGFPGLPGWRPATAAHSIPIEMTSGDGLYVLRAELPGMDPADYIGVTVEDDLVTVTGEHRESKEDKEHSEFRYGLFRRTVRLPVTVPAHGGDASYAHGILTVRIPMPDEQIRARRTIPVKRADTADDGGKP